MEASRSSGDINSVNTMEAMNKKIMVMDMARAEIRMVDSQESLDGGVTVLVTGHLTGGDGVRREFSWSFLLAPQEKGYNSVRFFVWQMVKLPAFQCGDDNYGRLVVARGGTKNSCASIVRVMKKTPLSAPTPLARPAPPKPEKQPPAHPATAPAADVPPFSSKNLTVM